MGGGGSKVEEHKAKISAMSAMQAKMKQLEQDLIDKDLALQKERKLHVAMKDAVRGELKKPDPVPKKASQKKKKKKKKKLLPNGCVDKERMKELAKMSSWSLEPDMLEEDETESEPEPESESEPEPEPKLEVPPEPGVQESKVSKDVTKVDERLASPVKTSTPVAKILGTTEEVQEKDRSFHYQKVQAQVTALNAFKQDFQKDLMASKSKLRQRIQRRKSERKLRKANSGGLSKANSKENIVETTSSPPPPLPPRPKVTSVEYHTFSFGPGTLGINFEEMKDEPPYSMFIWSVVQGWQGQIQGILADDILIQINDTKLEDLDFDDVMNLLLTSSRPLILKVRRDKYAEQQQQLEPKDMEKEDTTTKKKEDTTPKVLLVPKLPPRKQKISQTMVASSVEEIVPS